MMPPETVLNMPWWAALLLVLSLTITFLLVSWPQGEESKTVVKVKSPLFDRFQKRQREMQQAKILPMSREWRTEKQRGSESVR